MSATVHQMTGHVKSLNLSGSHLARMARFRLVAERHLENLGAAIRKERERRKLSRRELGDQVGAVEKTIERWENGKSGGAMEALDAIADALRVSTDDIMALAAQLGRERRREEAPESNGVIERLDALEAELQLLRSTAPQELEQALDAEAARQSKPTSKRTAKSKRGAPKK